MSDFDEDEIEQHGQTHDPSSRNWLQPASVSLHRLHQVKTNVYNIGLADPKQLKGGSSNNQNRPSQKKEVITDPAVQKHGSSKISKQLGPSPPDSKPPLSKLSSQLNAWGSNPSIPTLIKQQTERQRCRPESAKNVRPPRPQSGKKPRPHSAKESSVNHKTDKMTAGPNLGVRGEKFDPGERPEGSTVNLTGGGWVAPPGGLHDLSQKEIENTIQEFMDGQLDVEYLYSRDDDIDYEVKDPREDGYFEYIDEEEGAPRAPRASPDFSQMVETDYDLPSNSSRTLGSRMDDVFSHRQRETPVPRQPGLLRKPKKKKPEPILSIPHAQQDHEEEEFKVSFEQDHSCPSLKFRTVIHRTGSKADIDSPAEQQKSNADTSHQVEPPAREASSPLTLIGQEDRNFTEEVEKLLTSLDNEERDRKTTMEEGTSSHKNEQLFTHPKRVGVNIIIENPGDGPPKLHANLQPTDNDNKTDTNPEDLEVKGHNEDDLEIKGHSNVKFDENKNTTIAITPRKKKKTRPTSAKPFMYEGRPDLRYVKSRVNHGMNISSSGKNGQTDDKSVGETDRHRMLIANQNKSPHSIVSTIELNYQDDGDSDQETRTPTRAGNRITKPSQEVETMMSRFGNSSEDEGKSSACESETESRKGRPTSATVRISQKEANYYEMAKNMRRVKFSDDEDGGDNKPHVTTKTLELLGDGHVKETISVTAIDAHDQKPKKEYIAPRPLSASRNKHRPSSAKPNFSDTDNQTNTTDGPPLERPESRLGFREDDTIQDQENHPLTDIKRKRVMSAPPVRTTDALGRRIAEIHDGKFKPPTGQGCACLSHTHSKSSSDMATKGSSCEKSARRHYTGYALNEEKKKPERVEYTGEVIEIWTRKEEFEIETEGVKECKEIQLKLLNTGVPVTLEALKRGLLPPTEYGFHGPTQKTNVYPQITPDFANHGLLSNPKTSWLSQENKRVTEARRRVRDATKALEEQRLEEARLAIAAEAKAKKREAAMKKQTEKRSGKRSSKKRGKSSKKK